MPNKFQMKISVLALFVAGIVAASAGDYKYGEVIGLSLLFYEAQRTGVLPPTNRIAWRGDSFVTDIGEDGEDLSGGFFDAGDHAKFGFPLAGTMTMLAWGMYDSKVGYQKSGEWINAVDNLRWGMDYMIKTHPSPNVLYIQVGDTNEDHSYWGRPEEWTGSNPRPTLRANATLPATETAAEYAAAMAAASMVFAESGETEYSATLLKHAEELYSFANTYRGHNYESFFPELTYRSWNGYNDELFWAAAWLYRATDRVQFRDDYNRFWTEFGLNYRPDGFGWDDKLAGAQILLAKIDGSAQYVNAAKAFCDWAADEAPKTPLGLTFLGEWGSLRSIANVVFACSQAAASGINTDHYRTFVKAQIDYMLGDGGRSYVVGYGHNPPVKPHHRASSCPDRPDPCFYTPDGPNPQVLYGALVGGPGINDDYEDDRGDYVKNEVAIDYNAGFQSALAELSKLYDEEADSGSSGIVISGSEIFLKTIGFSLLFRATTLLLQ